MNTNIFDDLMIEIFINDLYYFWCVGLGIAAICFFIRHCIVIDKIIKGKDIVFIICSFILVLIPLVTNAITFFILLKIWFTIMEWFYNQLDKIENLVIFDFGKKK